MKGCEHIGLYVSCSTSETIVVATRCEFANSRDGAIIHSSSTSATFNNCVFHDNSDDGIYASNKATIHLHGEATAIRSNGNFGISAYNSAKVIIHLPSHHNTSYNNGKEDRFTRAGGTITNDIWHFTSSLEQMEGVLGFGVEVRVCKVCTGGISS